MYRAVRRIIRDASPHPGDPRDQAPLGRSASRGQERVVRERPIPNRRTFRKGWVGVSRLLAKARHDQPTAGRRGLRGQENCKPANIVGWPTRNVPAVSPRRLTPVEGPVLKPPIRGNVFRSQPDPISVTRQLPGNHVASPATAGRLAWAVPGHVGQTGRSSRWSHNHPGRAGKPRTGRRARGITVRGGMTYEGARPDE